LLSGSVSNATEREYICTLQVKMVSDTDGGFSRMLSTMPLNSSAYMLQVKMVSDPNGGFSRMLGVDLEAPATGGAASQRYAGIVQDGILIRMVRASPQ
jgi:peroxiredoxin